MEVEEIELEEFDLKLLAQIPCKVSMDRFNVLHSLEEKLNKQEKESGKSRSAEEKQEFLEKHAYPSYKKFYRPRESWFQEQRKAAQHLRQNKRHDYLINIKNEKLSEHFTDEWISTTEEPNSDYVYVPNSDDVYKPNSDDLIGHNSDNKKTDSDVVEFAEFEMISGTTSTQTYGLSQEI